MLTTPFQMSPICVPEAALQLIPEEMVTKYPQSSTRAVKQPLQCILKPILKMYPPLVELCACLTRCTNSGLLQHHTTVTPRCNYLDWATV